MTPEEEEAERVFMEQATPIFEAHQQHMPGYHVVMLCVPLDVNFEGDGEINIRMLSTLPPQYAYHIVVGMATRMPEGPDVDYNPPMTEH